MRLAALLAATALAGPALAQSEASFTYGQRNTDFIPAFDGQTRAPIQSSGYEFETEVVAGGLEHPWGIAAMPEGGYLVTERAGRLRHVADDGTLSEPLAGVPEVLAREQGGLLDVALSPDFAEDRAVFLTYSKPMGDGLSVTAAGRGTLSQDMTALEGFEDVFVQDPPSANPMHYGSRIVFDGEGHAYVTTGEHFSVQEREYAQHLDKTYGKVIRIGLDGSVPEDNPFVGRDGAVESVWSLGHRNVQGAVVAPDGTLWTIEHGPQGGDELNRTEAGLNYGWPVITYGQNYDGSPVGSGEAKAEGMEQPVYFWDPVIAPGGMDMHEGSAFSQWNGDLLIGSLYPGGVVRVELGEDGRVTAEERLLRDAGRVRTVQVLADGSFVYLTDTPDGEIVHVAPKAAS